MKMKMKMRKRTKKTAWSDDLIVVLLQTLYGMTTLKKRRKWKRKRMKWTRMKFVSWSPEDHGEYPFHMETHITTHHRLQLTPRILMKEKPQKSIPPLGADATKTWLRTPRRANRQIRIPHHHVGGRQEVQASLLEMRLPSTTTLKKNSQLAPSEDKYKDGNPGTHLIN
jgi:hypothetical protein